MFSKKFVTSVLPDDTYPSQVQSRLAKLPSTPAMIWYTLLCDTVVAGPPRKSSTRNSCQGSFGPTFVATAGPAAPSGSTILTRVANSCCSAGGIGRPSIGTGADHTVIAGG